MTAEDSTSGYHEDGFPVDTPEDLYGDDTLLGCSPFWFVNERFVLFSSENSYWSIKYSRTCDDMMGCRCACNPSTFHSTESGGVQEWTPED